MDGSEAGTVERARKIPNRLTAKVAGPALAAGAVSLGLVMIGACGLGHRDTYVAPPPLNADLQAAPTGLPAGTTTFQVVIPPSPTWRVAGQMPRRHTESSTPTSPSGASGAPAADRAPAEPAADQPDNLAPSRNTTPKPTTGLQPAVTPTTPVPAGSSPAADAAAARDGVTN